MTETEPRDKCDSICVVCCRALSISAIGECDHPVCYECATRMRVLCQQNECPICRRELPKVIFSEKRKQYADVATIRYHYCDRKYQLYFEDDKIQQAYYKLIEHVCPICHDKQVFETFDALSRHVRKVHDLNYCDICAKHLMIFTHERKCYNRRDLAIHKRIGDADDTSHRGHPLCEFCEERFLDDDELFRHLRREHFYCHFCDMDGLNHYYSDYEYLRKHFRVEHFLCEEGECLNEKFTTAFRTEIDLKAHKATVHNKGLTKAQAKQARTLELEFTIAPRGPAFAADSASRFYSDDSGRREAESGKGNKSRSGNLHRGVGGYPQTNNSRYDRHSPSEEFEVRCKPQGVAHSPQINMNSNQDFPVLGTDSKPTTSEPSSSATNGSGLNSKTANNYSTSGNNSTDTLAQKLAKINRFSVGKNLSDAEFPALHKEENASSVPPNVNSKTKGVNSWSAAGSAALSLTSSQLPSNSLSKNTLTLKLNSHEEFPGLVSSTKKQHLTPNLSIQLSSKPRQPHGSSGNTENQHEPKTNSHSCVSSGRNSRDHPVVTRLEGTQNITFLNPPSTRNAHTSGASVSVSGDVVNGNNTGFKDGLSKTDSGWYVLKKGKVSKANADEEQSVTCLSITSLDDFPDLEVKNGKCEKKEARIVVPINNSWTNSQDTKPSKVIESSSQPQKVIGKNKKKKKSYTASNGTDSSKDAALKSEPEKNDARCPDNHLKLATDDCDENCKSGISAVEIKRSELTLEGLSPNSDNNNVSSSLTNESIFTVEDFPQLSFTTMLKSYQTPPSLSQSDAKPSRPPPGFSLPHNTSLTTTKPPPGFEMCCVSGIQSFDCNRAPASPTSVTFTNSSGQNFALPATIPYHSYYPPNDFQKRNQKLTLHLYNSLSEGDFSTFKEISGMFRQNIISANDYYQHCVKLIGKERFEIIFPELLILLPDISKQQDLLAAYNTHKKEKDSRNAASESYNFLVCASCQQVLTSSDFVEHENIHQIDTDFPALGNSLETVHVSWLKQK